MLLLTRISKTVLNFLNFHFHFFWGEKGRAGNHDQADFDDYHLSSLHRESQEDVHQGLSGFQPDLS